MHLFRNLHIDIKKLGDASIETYGFARVEVRLAIGGWDAFGSAGLDESGAGQRIGSW